MSCNAVASKVHCKAVLTGDMSSLRYDGARHVVGVSIVQVQTCSMCKYEAGLVISITAKLLSSYSVGSRK